MAGDEGRNGTIFMYQTKVLPDPFSKTPENNEPQPNDERSSS
jgi:hypothetical protein